ncbi:sorting nexin-33-like isoform X2 [Amphiura filiformis]|uniref:sorting nexin-33-like isoform X2 n=1 Tax=Amphiura filiformis TaxID=82378 RepID=UPI003B21A879
MHLRARVMYDFDGEVANGELTIKEDEVLNILRQDVGDGWWEAENSQGVKGLVPQAYCEAVDGTQDGTQDGVSSPGSSVPSPSYDDRQDGVDEEWDYDEEWDGEPGSPTRKKAPTPQSQPQQGSNGSDPGQRGPLQKSTSLQVPDPPPLTPLQRSLAASMHGHSSASTMPNRGKKGRSSARQEHWPQESDDESSIASMPRRVSDSGLNGQGNYGLHGANRHMKRGGEVKTGTVSKTFKSRFSVFAKSGGEAYLLGADTKKRHIPANTEVRIVESDEGPMWEDPGGDWRFTCEITNPKKESKLKGMKSFIAYQLTPSNTGIRVSRRYKHFDWLYERLSEKFTLICVPQLPDKQVTGRYEESFIERRMDGLQRWMARMTSHPIISQCDAFQHFISCTDEKQWKVGKRKAEKDELVGAAFLQTITPPDTGLEVAHVETQHDNFAKFVKSMNDSMVVIQQTFHESRKRHMGPFKREYQKVGQSFNAIAESFEIDTRPRVNGNDAPPQESVRLTDAVKNTGKTYEDIGLFFAQQPSKDLIPFEDFLREYHGMIQTFPDMIQFHKHTISTVKECQKQREDQKMDFEEAESVKQRADVVSYAMMAEINHFQDERVRNFKEAMEGFLTEQIKFYQNVTAKLEDALGKFQDI